MALQDAVDLANDPARLLAQAEHTYETQVAELGNSADPHSKKQLAEATARYGTAIMNSAALAPFEKYPRALKIYAKALELDPENKEAKDNRQMILDIYDSLGKKPPTE